MGVTVRELSSCWRVSQLSICAWLHKNRRNLGASLSKENFGHGVGTVRHLTETARMKEEGEFKLLQLHMARVSVAFPSSSFPSLFANGSPRITILCRGMEFRAATITSTDDLCQSQGMDVLMPWILGVVLPLLAQYLGARPGNVHCAQNEPLDDSHALNFRSVSRRESVLD